MGWSFTIKLLPGEEILEEGNTESKFGMMAEHTPVLTNQRVMFKFNTFSTGMVQSFIYDDITGVVTETRLMIRYLKVSMAERDHYLKVDDPEKWAAKINEYRERFKGVPFGPSPESVAQPVTVPEPGPEHASTPRLGSAPDRQELMIMLDKLRTAGILTDDEFREKRKTVLGI